MAFGSVAVGQKGRIVLPANVRKAAHLSEGEQVIAHADGEGRIIVETVAAIRAKIWADAPEPTGLDATEYTREIRNVDNRLAEEADARRSQFRDEAAVEEAGEALLRTLGKR